ncbi:hypothetical protein [Dysosmobacter sp.]
MNIRNPTANSTFTPFDRGALIRQKRMGLLREDGCPDKGAAAAMARLYAGLFYDCVMDFYKDQTVAFSVCNNLAKTPSETGTKDRFLSICSAYDGIYHDLPEPMWWIAGNLELVACFTENFICRLAELMEENKEVKPCAM